MQGRQQYLWRAVDEDGDVIDILVQSRRNRGAAARFFRKLLKGQGREPRRLITDKLRSYAAAHRTAMPSVVHSTRQYENNRAELSHQPTRQRERQMRRFKSAAHLQRFASVHGVVQNLFRVGRHLLRAAHHRLLRTQALVEWDAGRAPADRARALRAEGETRAVSANLTVPFLIQMPYASTTRAPMVGSATPARLNSFISSGISNRLMLYPARSQSERIGTRVSARWAKVGLSATASSEML